MSIEDSFDKEFMIVNVKVIKNMEKRRNRVSSFMLNKPQPNNPKEFKRFYFFYDLQTEEQPVLYGVNSSDFRYN